MISIAVTDLVEAIENAQTRNGDSKKDETPCTQKPYLNIASSRSGII